MLKRFVLLLSLAVTACGDDIRPRLNRCKDDIRAELTALLEKTKREAAESLEALEPATPTDRPHASETAGAAAKFSDEKIKAMPDMFAAMAVPVMEAQLKALEPTAAGLAKCEQLLAQARQ